jgi:hypothetical protein
MIVLTCAILGRMIQQVPDAAINYRIRIKRGRYE